MDLRTDDYDEGSYDELFVLLLSQFAAFQKHFMNRQMVSKSKNKIQY